jgi:hypothetical protein
MQKPLHFFKHLGMHRRLFRASLSLGIVAVFSAASLTSCRAGRNFYVLEEIRVPGMQVLQKVNAGISPAAGQHCFELNGEPVCQQYPLRPSESMVFRFLAIAPATPLPMTLSVTKLRRAKLPQTLTQESDCQTIRSAVARVKNEDVPLSTLGLTESSWTRQLKQETPMHIEEHLLSFKNPSAQTLLTDAQADGWLPLFTLDYEAKVEGGSFRSDRGSFTFLIASAPQNNAGTDGGSGSANSDSARCLAEAFAGNNRLTSNTPPFIKSISPALAAKVSGSPLDLQLTLSDADPDDGARRRVQWYLSRGEIENQRAATSRLTFSGAEPLTAVGVVRDLQGGLDFAWTTFSVN